LRQGGNERREQGESNQKGKIPETPTSFKTLPDCEVPETMFETTLKFHAL